MSQTDVSYSCGSCGYPLNLSSSNRITSDIDSEYKKSIKKGVISFISIDLSRFTQVDKVHCFPVPWGRYGSKTKLLCRKCEYFIGYGHVEPVVVACGLSGCSTSSTSTRQKYRIKIRALQPTEQ